MSRIVNKIPFPAERWAAYDASGSAADRNAVVEAYLPLVQAIAGKLSNSLPRHVGVDELASHGVLGLIDAIRLNDPARRSEFAGFAVSRIYGAIFDGIREHDPLTRMARDRSTKYDDTVNSFRAREGRPPTDDEIVDLMKLTPKQYRFTCAMVKLSRTAGLEDAIGPWFAKVIADENQDDPSRRMTEADTAAWMLSGLPPRANEFARRHWIEGVPIAQLAREYRISETGIFYWLRIAKQYMKEKGEHLRRCA